ncbi:MAG: hypothetical protein GTO05_17480 [Gemmatimonadales bacterium]|nr:hypothetical protein [Gemmatimonadales bacterium]NIS66916.1 hypothetical protein [Gemmatimonadales bacterium]
MTLPKILIAVAIGVAIFWILRRILTVLATPPPEIDPGGLEAVEDHYRCSICGTELTVTAASLTETEPPKHCREEMTLTWRAE